MKTRRRILVRGIVQGVGFRPFVYRLARELTVTGWVNNDSAGVVIEVQGEVDRLDLFSRRLVVEAPPLAVITSLAQEDGGPTAGESDFVIRSSRKEAPASTLISPDIAVCAACLDEMRDPRDRRYRYPFINCTDCGPRYTIIEDIPYDRPRTTMKTFTMCPECRREYENPLDRRFHAQPNACPACGPRLALLEADGSPWRGADPLAEARLRLKAGRIGALKGLGGFHLAVDAGRTEAVLELRRRKLREEKPLAVMTADLESARRVAEIAPDDEKLLVSPRRPIVLLPRSADGGGISPAVAPGNDSLGVMLPYAPLHHLLLDGAGFAALVMTSANLSEEPICIANDEAVRRLAGIADFFLTHDRDIHVRADDAVLRIFRGRPYHLRRSRGWAPAPLILHRTHGTVMGLGGELKNTVCLLRGELAFLSQHVGDLENEEAFAFFRQTVKHLERILECRAGVLACDRHPDYLSTRYAQAQVERPVIAVQHHHAHAVSCMAEHGLTGPVLAVTFDGTGYGDDGGVWGGEFLVATPATFRRAGHLREVALPGGAAAVREPWRMAVAYLQALYGQDVRAQAGPLLARFPAHMVETLLTMIDRGLNTFRTTSAGRLFDAVASLTGIRDTVSFEGQAAMALEQAASHDPDPGLYPYRVFPTDDRLVLDTLPMVEALVAEVRSDVERGRMATRFHHTLAAGVRDMLLALREREGLDEVVLSGGVFQNMQLLERCVTLLQAARFRVYWHEQVPPNDGGLSLGQAVAAHAIHSKGG